MDRSLKNQRPDIAHADNALQERIIAGHNAILEQVEYFRSNFGTADSRWKKDGTRVTIVDETISHELFKILEKEGVPTHFVEMLDDRNMLMKKVEIVKLEVIVRNIAAGSFTKRYGVEEGTVFDAPTFEFSYKYF